MIIGINGRIGSGKDTVAKIIQYLTLPSGMFNLDNKSVKADLEYDGYCANKSDWKIIRFADKLKDFVCSIIGCTREELEDRTFKNKPLGKEWIRYAYANGFTKDDKGNTSMLTVDCDEERYKLELKTNWQTAYKVHYTPRLLLQRIGTEVGRQMIHPNIWVNATMSNYSDGFKDEESKWIIPDTRFINEADAIIKRKGLLIQVVRYHFQQQDTFIRVSFYNQYESLFDINKEINGTIRFNRVKNREELNKFIDVYQLVEGATDFEEFKKIINHPSENTLEGGEFDHYFTKTFINTDSMDTLINEVRNFLKEQKII